jgi:hypothetical protein
MEFAPGCNMLTSRAQNTRISESSDGPLIGVTELALYLMDFLLAAVSNGEFNALSDLASLLDGNRVGSAK